MMGISIKFAMKPKRKWFPGSFWDFERAKEHSQTIAAKFGYPCEVISEYLVFQLCPEGFVLITFQKQYFFGECYTSLLGAGFHAAVIELIEAFAKEGNLKLRVEDPFLYYYSKDFQKLRDRYVTWFEQLVRKVVEEETATFLHWPKSYYIPKERAGMVITHIRPFYKRELYGMVHSGLIMAFAKEFFIWNEQEKDAYYYRNCAMVLLNQECYFMPSSRSKEDESVNQEIISYLESALELDDHIPFPKTEYLKVCELDAHIPKDISRTTEVCKGSFIGSRTDIIFREMGNIRFGMPGYFLYDKDSGKQLEHYYDCQNGCLMDYFICAIRTKKEAEFQEESFRKEGLEEVFDLKIGVATLKIAVYHPSEKISGERILVSAQILYQTQVTIINFWCGEEKKEWAIGLMKEIQLIE